MASVAANKPYLTPNAAAAQFMVAPATPRVWAELAHTFRPDVALLDLVMAGLDGYQVCHQIESNPATRIIAMTGLPASENSERIRMAGVEIRLPKPPMARQNAATVLENVAGARRPQRLVGR